MNGISALRKEVQGTLFLPSTVGKQQQGAIYEVESGSYPDAESASTLVLNFPGSKTVRNWFLLL